MRLTALIAMVSSLFLVSASGLCAGDLPSAPGGWAATPSLHIKGHGSAKNIQPNLITGYGYNPSQIKAAYGIRGTGAGQTIAIVDAYGFPTIYEDLSTFCRTYRLPQANLQVHYMGGQGYDAGWALETSLDTELAHALAPGAVILLVVAQSPSLPDLFAAVQYAGQNAQVVSMSWSGDELSNETTYDSVFQHPGTVFVAASGTRGPGPSTLPRPRMWWLRGVRPFTSGQGQERSSFLNRHGRGPAAASANTNSFPITKPC